MTRIAVNGFGRIGRNTLRALLERESLDGPDIDEIVRQVGAEEAAAATA